MANVANREREREGEREERKEGKTEGASFSSQTFSSPSFLFLFSFHPSHVDRKCLKKTSFFLHLYPLSFLSLSLSTPPFDYIPCTKNGNERKRERERKREVGEGKNLERMKKCSSLHISCCSVYFLPLFLFASSLSFSSSPLSFFFFLYFMTRFYCLPLFFFCSM